MAATVVQMAVVFARDRKLATKQKIELALVMAFGTLTLALHDERFIKWKPTVIYTAMAIGMGVALWVYRKNFIRLALAGQLELPDNVWRNLGNAWVAYCAFMAASNAYVVMTFSTEFWVDFKAWGFAFPIAFIVAQGFYIAPHIKADDTPDPEPKP
jgi:intracellular septation protein